jgi:hypothetical protein
VRDACVASSDYDYFLLLPFGLFMHSTETLLLFGASILAFYFRQIKGLFGSDRGVITLDWHIASLYLVKPIAFIFVSAAIGTWDGEHTRGI